MNPGFIGLGQLGARLASVALKADQSIVVFDLDSSRVSGLSQKGAVAATSVVDLAPVILNGSLNTGFTTDLGLKDLGFVVDLGGEISSSTQADPSGQITVRSIKG